MNFYLFANHLQLELRLHWRRRAEWLVALAFYLLVVLLFPLALDPKPALLVTIAPAVLGVALLLSSLMAAEPLFRAELHEGTLDVLRLSPIPLWIVAASKWLAHSIVTGLPLIALMPFLSVSYGLDFQQGVWLSLLWLLALPVLSLLCCLSSLLMLSLPRSGGLLSVVLLPLVVPLLTLVCLGVRLQSLGWPMTGPLFFLIGLSVLALTVGPLLLAAVLRSVD